MVYETSSFDVTLHLTSDSKSLIVAASAQRTEDTETPFWMNTL